MILILKVLFFMLISHSVQINMECSSQKVSIVTDLDGDISNRPNIINATHFLWHVAVLKEENEELMFLCSGTLFQAKFVLTAAKCVVQVSPSHLRVVANLSLLHSPLEILESSELVYNISKKYYPYHNNGLTQEEDLAVLKLEQNVTFNTPLLTALQPTERLSKHCFTLGWGAYNGASLEISCQKPNVQKALTVLLNQPHQSTFTFSRIFDIRNSLSLSTSFMFKVFNIFSRKTQAELSNDLTCPMDDYAHFKMAKVSAKSKRDWVFCANNTQICISGWNSTDLSRQVDIGSPVFCKVKKPKLGRSPLGDSTFISQFGLAGVITSKETDLIHVLKLNSSVNIMRADNITNFAHFIFSVLKQND